MGSNPILSVTYFISNGYPLMVNGLPSKQELWVRFPLPVCLIIVSIKINNVPTSSSRTASLRLAYFYRGGNREGLELLLRKLLYNRALKARQLSKSQQAQSINSISTSNLFRSFFRVATPFVALKLRRRRRGKRVVAKIALLDRERGERKALGMFSSSFKEKGAASVSFSERLERELKSLSSTSTAKGANTPAVGASGINPLQEKRDTVHRLAFKSRPYR